MILGEGHNVASMLSQLGMHNLDLFRKKHQLTLKNLALTMEIWLLPSALGSNPCHQ